jgi:hypothetical protein
MLSGTTFVFGHAACLREAFAVTFFAALFKVGFFFVAMHTLLGTNETHGPEYLLSALQ